MHRCSLKARSWAAGLAKSIQDEYNFTFEEHCCRIWRVRDNLLAVDYPSAQRRSWLATRLNQSHGEEYLVVNLSGETYDTVPFQGPVMDVVMSGGAVVPLEVLVRLCVSVHKWLSCNADRRLVAHGTDPLAGESRDTPSAKSGAAGAVVLLFGSYLSWVREVMNPKEGLIDVCQCLGIPHSCIWPSQRRYLSYFECLQHGLVQLDTQPHVTLTRIVIVGAGGDGIPRVCEVWQQDRKLEHLRFEAPEADGAIFQIKAECRGDISIRILRHEDGSLEDGSGKLEAQVCLHTAFMQDAFARFPWQEIDCPSGRLDELYSIDLYFELHAEEASPRKPDLVAAMKAAAGGPKVPDLGGEPTSGPQCFDMSDDNDPDSPGGKFVFKPDDIDAFFEDL